VTLLNINSGLAQRSGWNQLRNAIIILFIYCYSVEEKKKNAHHWLESDGGQWWLFGKIRSGTNFGNAVTECYHAPILRSPNCAAPLPYFASQQGYRGVVFGDVCIANCSISNHDIIERTCNMHFININSHQLHWMFYPIHQPTTIWPHSIHQCYHE